VRPSPSAPGPTAEASEEKHPGTFTVQCQADRAALPRLGENTVVVGECKSKLTLELLNKLHEKVKEITMVKAADPNYPNYVRRPFQGQQADPACRKRPDGRDKP
jgi:hypothetical protein